MKKKFLNKQLQLNKETISNLNQYEMKKIAGGSDIKDITDYGNPSTTAPTYDCFNPVPIESWTCKRN